MDDHRTERPSLKDFDPFTDRNGQRLGGTSPPDLGVPSRTQADLERDPTGEAIERATAVVGSEEVSRRGR